MKSKLYTKPKFPWKKLVYGFISGHQHSNRQHFKQQLAIHEKAKLYLFLLHEHLNKYL